ncbi:MAG TPA: ECF-type sigma factor [Thermoanaerobaculia bacterium]|nr:ECF-type sigma factor [Thermoanaerobaculia bacterium]
MQSIVDITAQQSFVAPGPPSRGAVWEELICRYGPSLKRRVGRVLRRSGIRPRGEQVEELLQEVYCRLLAAGSRRLLDCRASSERQVGAYLGRIAERVVLDQLRAARAWKRGGRALADRVCLDEDVAERVADPRATPEDLLLSAERLALLLVRCGELVGRRQRRRNARIFALALLGGLSGAEISCAIGGRLSPRGVDALLRRIRRRLAAARRARTAAAAGLPDRPALPPLPAPERPARSSRCSAAAAAAAAKPAGRLSSGA